jgi:hypothetical protein
MDKDKVIEAVKLCAGLKGCMECPYYDRKECRLEMLRDVRDLLEAEHGKE